MQLKNRTLLATAVAAFGCAGLANAATLTANFEPNKPLEIMNADNDPNSKADISVVDGRAGYQGIGGDPNNNQPANNTATDAPASGLFGDGTVVDYRFFKSPADENISLELQTYAQGNAGRIGTVFATSPGQVAGSQSLIQVWETTDPGAGFGGGSQVTPAAGANFTSQTMAGLGDGSGTIDISNMTEGDIYFLAGGAGIERFTLTMTGAGQSDIVEVGQGSWPRDNRVHLHDWSFENADLLYDTITYDFYHGDQDGSFARFGGVILDGNVIPEPGSLALLGLGGLLIAGRRRRA